MDKEDTHMTKHKAVKNEISSPEYRIRSGLIRTTWRIVGVSVALVAFLCLTAISAAAGPFPSPFELSTLDGPNGFVVDGVLYGTEQQGLTSVSVAGDVNGDGVIGSPYASPNGKHWAGQSYVVFGRSRGSPFPAVLALSSLDGSNGFVLNGISAWDESGFSVSGAGDVNGDGIDDVVIGAPDADPHGKSEAGQSYVIFGRPRGSRFPAVLELSSLDGRNGFTLNGKSWPAYTSGWSVAGAGDVNGDGVDDVLIGAALANPNGKQQAGESYVVFGKPSGFSFPAVLELSSLDGSNGFTLNGVVAYDEAGWSVSGAGDTNGDGIDDFLIGAPHPFEGDPVGGSQTYVVFGRPKESLFPAVLELSSLDGRNGFVLNGIASHDRSGWSVSRGGDVNGDSVDDLLIGATGPNQSCVVFGRPKGSPFPAVLELSSLDGSNGFTANLSGWSVAGAGDVNGDGVDDFLIGDPGADPNGKRAAGQSYLIYGRPKGSPFPAVLELPTLDGSNGFVINGVNGGDNFTKEGDSSGFRVSGGGDLNGDGLDDFVIVAVFAKDLAGQTYVVFGQPGLPDTTPPSCAVTDSGTNALGQRFTKISCQDGQSGLASIQRTKSSNYTVKIPSFTVGTTNPVVVTATKIDNAVTAWVTLKLSDVAGNIGFYDPVELEIERTTGKPQSETLTGIPRAESKITIYNGNPGLTTLYIGVNGTKLMVAGLRNKEVRDIDVSGAMAASNNTITLEARGKPGGSATILIHD